MELNQNYPQSGVVVLFDEGDRAHISQIGTDLGASIFSISETGVEMAVRGCHVMVHINLNSVVSAQKIKAILKNKSPEKIVLFVVNMANHAQKSQAKSLGATDTIPELFTKEKVVELFGVSDAGEALTLSMQADKPAQMAAAIGEKAIGGLFAALNSNATLDQEEVTLATKQVVSTIGDQGLTSWLRVVRMHHKGTYQHCLLVAGVLARFGQKVGMSDRDTIILTNIGFLHDIGKAVIPIEILDKQAKLTDDEFKIMKTHTVQGYEYLRRQQNVSSEILGVVRHHHEYLDGSGYPDGLSGKRITDIVRIATVCDIYGALLESRAYKPPKTHDEAIAILLDMAAVGKVELALVKALEKAVFEG